MADFDLNRWFRTTVGLKNVCVYLVLMVILVVAASFRVFELGKNSMGIDVMEFYRIAKSGASPVDLIFNIDKYWGGVPAFWVAVHNAFIQLFQLPVTFFSVRLLDAITGILTVMAAFCMVRKVAGAYSGLLAAAFLAMHPIHIQMSRECYFYAPLVLGVVLMLWAIFSIANSFSANLSPKWSSYVLVLAGFVLVTNIHRSSWVFAAVAGVSLCIIVAKALIARRLSVKLVVVILTLFVIAGVPVFFLHGGFRGIYSTLAGSSASRWGEIFGKQEGGMFSIEYLAVLAGFMFGGGWLRGTVTLCFFCLASWRLVAGWRTEAWYRVFAGTFLGTLLLLLFVHSKSVFPRASRHLITLLPFFMIVFCLGYIQLVALAQRLRSRDSLASKLFVWSLSVVLLVGLFARPARWAMQAEGSIPYKHISEWVDKNLQPGTLVLSDRWLTPWNELRVNPATNVVYTFTVPNEPINAYEQNHWRESALKFLSNNPFAAYLDRKQYWRRLGPWEEPYDFFSRKHVIVDVANLKLDDIWMAYRTPGINYPREWQQSTIYYNTDEDVLARAKADSKRVLRGFGKGWRYLKPWQPMQGWPEQLMQMLWLQAGMFADGGKTVASLAELQKLPPQRANHYLNKGRWADYRIPGAKSPLRLFNLTESDLEATLTVTGVALSGNVRCMIGDQLKLFPATLMTQHKIPVTLKPGENEVVVAMPMNQFMLVHDVRLKPLEGMVGDRQ